MPSSTEPTAKHAARVARTDRNDTKAVDAAATSPVSRRRESRSDDASELSERLARLGNGRADGDARGRVSVPRGRERFRRRRDRRCVLCPTSVRRRVAHRCRGGWMASRFRGGRRVWGAVRVRLRERLRGGVAGRRRRRVARVGWRRVGGGRRRRRVRRVRRIQWGRGRWDLLTLRARRHERRIEPDAAGERRRHENRVKCASRLATICFSARRRLTVRPRRVARFLVSAAKSPGERWRPAYRHNSAARGAAFVVGLAFRATWTRGERACVPRRRAGATAGRCAPSISSLRVP